MTRRRWSWASRVFAAVAAAVAALAVVLGVALVLDAQRDAREGAAEVTRGVAEAVALNPGVAAALASDDPTGELQPFALAVIAASDIDFLTIMTPDGVRVTHPDPARIGEVYLGTIPGSPVALTEEFAGTLGPSVRTIVPVEADGVVVGWASAGTTLGSIATGVLPRIVLVVAVALAVLGAGLAGAAVARQRTRRIAGDLDAAQVRDTLAAYESVRTIGEALRAQTHEHGNRMHTAVSLLELGRTREAIDLLVATSAGSQALVDQVTARRGGDPTVGALLLGKAAQAAERGVAWTAEIDPDAPRSVLSPVDQVALVGNLVDNALDAAAAGAAPRWVSLRLAAVEAGLLLEVADSGAGIPVADRERVFEHGYSTKPADAMGRGVGLALVRSIVAAAGGSLELGEAAPTTFRVMLPAAAP